MFAPYKEWIKRFGKPTPPPAYPRRAAICQLHDDMQREKERVASETIVVEFRDYWEGACLHTIHNGVMHSAYWEDPCDLTVEVLHHLLSQAVEFHARRMPRHQEFAALAKEVAA